MFAFAMAQDTLSSIRFDESYETALFDALHIYMKLVLKAQLNSVFHVKSKKKDKLNLPS